MKKVLNFSLKLISFAVLYELMFIVAGFYYTGSYFSIIEYVSGGGVVLLAILFPFAVAFWIVLYLGFLEYIKRKSPSINSHNP